MDCEKVSILISTDIAGRIEESVEIKVGNVVHEVSIFEMGFKDTSVDKVSWAKNLEQLSRKAESKLEGSSESSSEFVRGSQVVEDEQSNEVEKAAINDMFFGKEFAASRGQDLGITERHIGEADLMGDFNSYEALKSGGDLTKGNFSGAKFQETEKLREDEDRVEKLDPCVAIKKTQLVDSDSPSFKATEDLHNMGLSQALADKEFGSKVASEGDSVTKGQAQGAFVEDVNRASFFPEMDFLKQRGKLKAKKKYNSLFELQDMVLSSVEKTKRDRSLHREKKDKSNLDHSELSGRSLPDSDLQIRWKIAKSEAKKSLELGKNLGMKIQGSEEVVREFTLLEFN
ncbi:hypothetical protein GQ457_12G031270 [Hibiscus cannabinus]